LSDKQSSLVPKLLIYPQRATQKEEEELAKGYKQQQQQQQMLLPLTPPSSPGDASKGATIRRPRAQPAQPPACLLTPSPNGQQENSSSPLSLAEAILNGSYLTLSDFQSPKKPNYNLASLCHQHYVRG